jgi:hypothetical protein
VFHFPKQQQIILRCWKYNTWTTRVETLIGSGLLINTTGCEITTGAFRISPELFGETEAPVGTPNFYLPHKAPDAADDEPQALKEITPMAVMQLDDVMARISARQLTLDLNSLFHIRQTSLQQRQQTYWHPVIIVASFIVTLLVILCFSVRSLVRNLVLSCFSKTTVPESNSPS